MLIFKGINASYFLHTQNNTKKTNKNQDTGSERS